MMATKSGSGYRLVAADGGHLLLRDRPVLRIDRRASRSTQPVVGLAGF